MEIPNKKKRAQETADKPTESAGESAPPAASLWGRVNRSRTLWEWFVLLIFIKINFWCILGIIVGPLWPNSAVGAGILVLVHIIRWAISKEDGRVEKEIASGEYVQAKEGWKKRALVIVGGVVFVLFLMFIILLLVTG